MRHLAIIAVLLAGCGQQQPYDTGTWLAVQQMNQANQQRQWDNMYRSLRQPVRQGFTCNRIGTTTICN